MEKTDEYYREEYRRCKESPKYFFENYCTIKRREDKEVLSESKLQDQNNISDLVFLLEAGLTPKEITKYGEKRVRKFLDKIASGSLSPFTDDTTGEEFTLPQSENTELIGWLEACLKAMQEGSPIPKVPQGLKVELDDGTRLALGKIRKTAEFGGGVKQRGAGSEITRIYETGVAECLQSLFSTGKDVRPEGDFQDMVWSRYGVQQSAEAIKDFLTQNKLLQVEGPLMVERDGEFMKQVNSLFTQYRGESTDFTHARRDKWNPADIWIYTENALSNLQQVDSFKKLDQVCDCLNGLAVGVSLKKGGNKCYLRDGKRRKRQPGELQDSRPTDYTINVSTLQTNLGTATGGNVTFEYKLGESGTKTYRCILRNNGTASCRMHFNIKEDSGIKRDYVEGSVGADWIYRFLDIEQKKEEEIEQVDESLDIDNPYLLEQEQIFLGEDPLTLFQEKKKGNAEWNPGMKRVVKRLKALSESQLCEILGKLHRVAVADLEGSCAFIICGK